MISILLEDKSIKNFEKALNSLQKTAKAIIIFTCDDNDFTKEALDPLLTLAKVPVIGGIFPSIVYKNKQYDVGTILLGLSQDFSATVIHNISSETVFDDVIEEKIGLLDESTKTMFLFFDAASSNIDSYIQGLFNNYGLSINYLGGSAGGKDFQKKPVIITNEGLLEDAAIFAITDAKSTIGVKHGWEPLNSTLLHVTKASGNIIYEIDYKPAFETYKTIVESQSSRDFSKEDFFDISKSFPLGINRLSGDPVVRVPSHTDGTFLACTGDVLENSYIYILHANNKNLIEAAGKASLLSGDNDYQTSFKLYIGCRARLLVLQETFHKELEAIYADDELLVGALSLGEIANNQDHYLELHNSTVVVARIEDAK